MRRDTASATQSTTFTPLVAAPRTAAYPTTTGLSSPSLPRDIHTHPPRPEQDRSPPRGAAGGRGHISQPSPVWSGSGGGGAHAKPRIDADGGCGVRSRVNKSSQVKSPHSLGPTQKWLVRLGLAWP